ncbi:MAG: sugar phosphate isomerase/epimerase family protein [Planctomycetota bacterium]
MSAEGKLGLMAFVGRGKDLVDVFERTMSFGIPTCQLHCFCDEVDTAFSPETVAAACDETGMEITAITAGFRWQKYDNVDGPATLGLVPPEHRERRVEQLEHFSDAVRPTGIENIVLHIGFIPDDERDPVYVSFIDMMKGVCEHLASNGQKALVETGSELASTLRRTIGDIGADNFGVNFDTANVILYGKSNPLDCVELFGEHVRACHLKDGVWPNRDEPLGHEVPLGEGQVDFPLVIRRLKEKGYNGPWTIEREAAGPEQDAGIRQAIDVLTPLI